MTAPVFTFLGMITPVFAAVQHQLECCIYWTFCQYLNKIICIAQEGASASRCGATTGRGGPTRGDVFCQWFDFQNQSVLVDLCVESLVRK